MISPGHAPQNLVALTKDALPSDLYCKRNATKWGICMLISQDRERGLLANQSNKPLLGSVDVLTGTGCVLVISVRRK